MSRRSGTLRPDFSRTDARKTKRSAANQSKFKRRLNHETLEKRELLAADLLAIRPDAGELLREQSVLNSPPREFSLLFNGDASIDESTISSDSIRLVRAGGDGVFGDINDVQVSIGYVGFVDPGGTDPENLNRIMLRPASTAAHNATDPSVAFPDDLYRIEIIGSGADPLMDSDGSAFNGGQDSLTTFRLDRGLQVIAVIPQPIERVGGVLEVQDKRIDVYFDDQEIEESVAETKEFYRLVDTSGAPTAAVNPDTVEYFPDENRVQLNFAAAFSTAAYRLDIGLQSALPGSAVPTDQPFAGEVGTWFGDLLNVGDAGNFGDVGSGTAVKVSSEISPAGAVALPARPGGTDEPGHREIQLENHYTLPNAGVGPVTPADVKVVRYAFPVNFRPNDAGIVYQNFISPSEKEIVRGILEIYATEVGVEFIETDTVDGSTLVIGKGDLQASTTSDTSAPGGVAGRGGPTLVVLDKEDYTNSDRTFGDGFTDVMFHEIGHALGLGHSYELHSVQGEGVQSDSGGSVTSPGDADLIHLQRISPANANDIDLYRFNLTSPGTVQIETIAERLTQAEHGKDPSLLNTVLRLFRKNADGTSEVIAQNDRYYGSDSFIDIELEAGEYFFGVSSTGNDQYDPAIADSGFGGTTDGEYEVHLSFNATPVAGEQLTDVDGTAIDGDGDGTPGGVHSFWFDNADAANTFYVDKLGANVDVGGATVASHTTIAAALLAAQAAAGRSVVRVVGSLDDSTPASLSATTPYLIGFKPDGTPLADGTSLNVPQDTTVRIEAGALVKMRAANIDVGTSSIGADRSGGAIQVLGTPELPVYLRSFHDDTVGGNSDGIGPGARAGDYGGIVMRDDSDLEDSGVFLNIVNHLDIRHGGGKGNPSDTQVYSPIDIVDARPTVSFNTITDAARAAVAATPDSFDDAGGRIGPDIVGNYLRGNTNNGLFVGIPTALGGSVQTMTVSGRFDDTDIAHILTESLIIEGNPGGPTLIGGTLEARPSGRLVIDPGTVIKLSEARIEAARGAATLIAEGTQNSPIIFTSLDDSRYGGSGVFDTNTGVGVATAGDWGGLFFSEASSGSIDHAVIAYGGGVVPTSASSGGGSDSFNAIEIHQAEVRVANSLITDNASGNATTDRFGRGTNEAAAIFVRGAQPILIGNEIVSNAGPAININANALTYESLVDSGRSIGAADRYSQFDDNRGPLVRLNETDNNTINAMKVRGQELTTESVWDDSDIVHVLSGEVIVENHHTYSGLRLQSSVSESLVIKVDGNNSGFTATGDPLDIVDRIGGTIQVIGLPGYPVVITHLADDTVGAGFTPDGRVNLDTDNDAGGIEGGDQWRGFLFDEWSNDRNVAIIREAESPLSGSVETNSTPITKAQPLGVLAPDMKSGDENRRLGFEVHGYISPNNSKDVDAYSFEGTAGTQIWIDIDRTDPSLDLVMELVLDNGTATGQVINTFDNPIPVGNANTLTQEPLLGGDFYSLSNNDPGASLTLPSTGKYFVRVKSAGAQVTSGEYQLQIRLQQVDEFPGSTVRYADIRYASTAFDVRGLPRNSPLIGDAAEAGDAGGNVTQDSAQQLVNLLETDSASLSIAGSLNSATDVDVYRFDVSHPATQVIPGVTTAVGTVSVVFDLDYADQKRGDTSIAVFNSSNQLIFLGRESNIEDDQPEVGGDGQSLDDLSRGSLGTDDPSIGPVHLTAGQQYYVAVMSNQITPSVVASQFSVEGQNGTGDEGIRTRLEPINSVSRVVEDHIGFTGYTTGTDGTSKAFVSPIDPSTGTAQGPLLDISSSVALDSHIGEIRIQDVPLFLATDNAGSVNGDNFYTVDPLNGGSVVTDLTPDNNNLTAGQNDIQDIVIRGDGVMFGYRRVDNNNTTVGELVTLDPGTGAVLATQADNISGDPNTANIPTLAGTPDALNRAERADEITNSDEVDAVTFRRDGDSGGDEPDPRYDVFYSVRESENSSRLYRGGKDGNADTAAGTAITSRYGFVGQIQPAGVTYAEMFYDVNNADANNFQSTTILLRSNIAGHNGNFTIDTFTAHNQTTAVTDVTGSEITLRLSRAGNPSVVTATAQDIVDAINSNEEARELVTAILYEGNTGNLDPRPTVVARSFPVLPMTTTNGVGTAEEVLQGRVTGLSMSTFDGTGSLYGVTSGGEVITISQSNGQATVLRVVPGVEFTGLTLGPQNVGNGAYKNILYASTASGEIYAFDDQGNFANVFNSGNANQLLTVTPPATPGTLPGEAFTLTFENGGTRQTTVPIDQTAPTFISVNEQQVVQSTQTAGTFSLSIEKSLRGISSLQGAVDATTTSIEVQNVTLLNGVADFPATPFVIEVDNEQMLVNSVTPNGASSTFTVVRGHNATTASVHSDTVTVTEVTTSSLAAAISDTDTSITVTDIVPLPTSYPFEIRIGNEDLQVTGSLGANQFSVVRGINGTTPVAASADATITQIQTTAALSFDATAPTIRNALAALPFVGGTLNVVALGDLASGVTIEFRNRLGSLDIAPLTMDTSNLRVNAVQFIDLDIREGDGTFTLEFDGDVTVPMNTFTSNATIQSALEALPSIGPGNVLVTEGPIRDEPIRIEFVGLLAESAQPEIVVDDSNIRDFEEQRVSVPGVPTGGTYDLTFVPPSGSPETIAINWNDDAPQIQAKLDSLPALTGNVFVINAISNPPNSQNEHQGERQYVVLFTGALADVDVNELQFDFSSLTGGTNPTVSVATLHDGGTAVTSVVSQTIDNGGQIAQVTPSVDGVRSVQDTLVALSNLAASDFLLRGELQINGINISFTGSLAGTDPALLDVNNFSMQTALASVAIDSVAGDGLGDTSSIQVNGLDGSSVGLAFSPADFNLWHPTMHRGSDAGHGVNSASDGSRDPGDAGLSINDGLANRDTDEAAGGASFYFGLEKWQRNHNASSSAYLTPTDRTTNAQYGILNAMQHQDLSSNVASNYTYDLAGGAKGGLTTNSFSLSGADFYDRPTLYFNYLLETEAAAGRQVSDINAENYFRDSARVYASRDGGTTWELLATNNSALSATDASNANGQAELPTFLSHLSDAGINSSDPQPLSKQIRQELIDDADGTPLWRQARVDLSTFAGEASVQLRFEFSTSGSSIQGDLPGDQFGDIGDADDSGAGQNNAFEGFYIDDLIVGFAERGEMVTAAPGTATNAFSNLANLGNGTGNRADVNRDDDSLTNQLSGEYQLEIRRSGEFAFGTGGEVVITRVFDTNERHILESILGSSGLDADRNREREQGILILESNIISDSRVIGVNVEPGTAESGVEGISYPGATQNFADLDDSRLVPGVVIQNNIIAGSSGINYSGEANPNPQKPVPIGRIINNTFIGDGGGIGVNVNNNASPTLLNNIFADLTTGIVNNGVGAIIDNNFFQNAGGPRGDDPRSDNNPLFVDAANGNYYPAVGAGTINNSQNVLNDRGTYAAFKEILGIPQSPFFAPTLDALGQLRVSGGVGGDGAGPNTDIDIGALDFSDSTQPYAVLLDPVDNDIDGVDLDPNDTFVHWDETIVGAFSILLSDGENPDSPFEGTGVNPATVNETTVTIRRNNEVLTAEQDFLLAFNSSTGELRLTPRSTLWTLDSVYEITLDNTQIEDLAGNPLRSNRTDGSTVFTIILPDTEIDFGDASDGSLVDSYGSLLINDGARHAVINDGALVLGSVVDGEADAPVPGGTDEASDLADEDGVDVGIYNDGTTDRRVFMQPGSTSPTTDNADVLGFLNPFDPTGSQVVVTASADGLLDAWIDFNNNKVFDANEQIFANEPLVAGPNTLTVFTPDTALAGTTWARFRISPEGNLSPTGLAVGGEVEDYQIDILPVALPVPNDDNDTTALYSVAEDGSFDTAADTLPSVTANDTIDPNNFTPITAIVVDGPSNAAAFTFDEATGHFTYSPLADFAGYDTFTYRLASQQTSIDSAPAYPTGVSGIATVTINVTPVNDEPAFAGDQQVLNAIEEEPRMFTKNDLLVGEDGVLDVKGDADPMYPSAGASAPWDESAQEDVDEIEITSIEVVPGTLITASGTYSTPRGEISVVFTGGFLEFLTYTGDQDLNVDNDRLGGTAPFQDTFLFTIQDNGNVINPLDIADLGDDVEVSGTPLSRKVTALINVRPTNDTPVASDDTISENNAGWLAYFNGLSPAEVAPVPTEDVSLTIPSAYLLLNDVESRAGANDELDNTNDAGLAVTAVDATSALGATLSIDVNGDVVYDPSTSPHAYGIDTFVYTITDQGVNQALDGTPTAAPLTHQATVTVLLNPVNDAPLAIDRDFELNEYEEFAAGTGVANSAPDVANDGNGILTITSAMLLRDGQSDSALEAFFSLRGDTLSGEGLFNEHETSVRVFGIGLPGSATPSFDATTLDYTAGDVTETLATANGTLTLTFSNASGTGELTEIVYVPNTDYNDQAPFDLQDEFTYFVEDFGEVTVHGAASVGEATTTTTHGTQRSGPATVSLTTRAVNDAPEFPTFSTVTFAEDVNADNAPVYYDLYEGVVVASGDLAAHRVDEEIFVSRDTALDERADGVQELTFTYSVDAPQGMFSAAPVLDEYGVLTLMPNPDVFGWAVIEITATDNGQSYIAGSMQDDFRSVTRTVTVNITPVNDAPVTFDRSLEVLEVEEYANGTGDATNAVASLPLSPSDFLGDASIPTELTKQSDFADDMDYDSSPGGVEYDEEEQGLRVVEFTVVDEFGNSVVVDKDRNNNVPITLSTGVITFVFDASGAFTTGEYLPNVDYNEQAPFDPTEVFSYIVEDFDATRIPGSEIPDPDAIGSIDYTSTNNRSAPKQMTLTTRAVNDAPEFPTFSTVTFAEDVNADDAPVYYDLYDGVVVASGDLAAHRVDEEIFVSQDTALDERVDGVQDLTFTYSTMAPEGMFSAEPVLDEYGILTLMPNPDVFGWAVIEITATDNGQSYIGGVMQDDFRSVTRTVTVNITPVNDAPVTFDRSLEVLEVEEFAAGTGDPTNVVATLVLTEDDFLGGTTANPERAEQSDFADDMDYDSSLGGVEYDEEEQGLRVVEFTVVDEFGNSVVVDKDRNNNVPITLSTGVITFVFDASGAFTTGEYLPNVDYNEQAPFDPTEVFSYIVEDFDVTRIPGSEIPDPDAIGSIDYTSTNNRSAPKQMTLTTRAVNDAPEFPTFSTVTFAEDVNADDAPVYYDLYDGVVVASGDLAAHRVDEEIFVSQDTALDERVDGVQDLTFTYSTMAPEGMFSAEPVLDEYGILTLMPNPDVFGWAVIEITATDNGQSYIGGVMQDDFRSVTRTVTVNITPVNDAPVTFDRSLEVLEVEEFAAGTGDPTNVVATLVLTEDDFLGGTTANPERAEQSDFADDMDYDSSLGGVEYDEEEQGLRVVEFTVVDEFGNSVVVDKDRNNNVPITLSTGVITFVFDASGAFTMGEYLPNVDYNEQAPFDPTEVFSYIVEDFDVTRIPGSEIPDPDATGSIDYTSTNNRSAPKQMTLTTRAVNDAPEFPVFSTVTFAEDVNADNAPVYYDIYGGGVIASNYPGVHGLDEMIFVSRDTALDERGDGAGHAATQNLTFTYSTTAPAGMFSGAPVLDEYGVLTLLPNPDVFGWAVIEITATDNGQSYIGGSMQDDFRSVTRTLTVNITPVNDAPVTFDRSLEVWEEEEYANGTGAATNAVASLPLAPEDFLGGTTANPELAEQSDFTDDVDYDTSVGGVEYDEEEQLLRVVQFTVTDSSGASLDVDRDNNNGVAITLATGVITFNFDASGAFTTGEYLPNVDYNEQTPFDPTEVFSYIVEDFDVTRIPGSEIPDPDAIGSIDYTSTNNRSAPKQMTLTTRAVNDAPRFDFNEGVFVLERDDLGQRNITDWASNILPSESTALDELATQGVRFELQTALSSIPVGLFAVPPTVSEDGTMRLTTSVDAVGTAELVFNVVDYSLSNDPGFVSKFVQVTTTVHVQPVNDAPRLDPSVVPTPEDTNASVDDRYHIESDGTLVITMTEDNQINGGGTYRIYLERDSSTERPGLLDLFVSGPSDEINGGQNVVGNPTTTAIAQSLQLTNFPATTTQGGTLVRGVEPGVDGREYLDYTPRSHQNIDTVGNDLFLYTVQDDGQTYTLGSTSFESGVLQSNPLSSMGRVRLVLNPVNDAPQFTIDPARVDGSGDVTVTVTEGAPAGVTFNLIADRAAGPATATDETDPVNGQTVTYHITPDPAVAYPGVFTTPPSVDALGRLTFAAGTEISGDFVFSIFAMDNGANDPTGRGDVNTSAATAFTISITPVNDPPEVKAGEDGIVSDTIAEEGSNTITEAELLAEFQGGPTAPAGSGAIDESTQGLVIFSGLPTDGGPAVTTTGGGTITRTGSTFTYTPALNFAGVDTVVYQISDTATPDSPNVPGTWLINVTPVNDAPDLGSLDLMVGLPEDIGAVRIDDWFAGVTVGPAGDSSGAGRANDEIDGLGTIPAQTFASITIRPVATDDRYRDLFQFTDGDLDSVVRLEGNTLVFDVLPGASGMATFDVIVTDDGSNDAPNVAVASTRLTITIDSSNDVPSFDVVGDNPIAVVEGDPLYIANWADNVSAGDTGQTSRFIVNVPAGDEDLFEVLPTIDATGEISFQFKEDANGSTVLGISLTDDADPNDGQLLTSDGLPALTSPEVLLTISITPVNDAPIANDNDFTTTEDNLLTFTVNDLLGNDTDIDVGDSLTLVQTGTLITELGATVNINSTGGLITYNPLGASEIQKLRPGTSVVDSFQYQVSDSEGELSNFATVRLTISGANDAPILGDDVIGFTYEENASGAPIAKSVTIPGNSIFDNDFDIDEGETIQPLTFTVTIQPQYGELRQDAVTGEVTYLPGANFLTEGNRQDSFEYTLNDAGGIVSGQPSAPATVHIVTRPTPTVDPIRTGTFNNASGTGTAVVDLDDLFVSVDGLDLAKTVIKINGQNGVAVINAAGQLVYTPNPGHTGEDTVTIEVEDVNGVKSGDVVVQFNTTSNERTNPSEPTDVNRNGFVTALDALMIINLLNSGLGGTSGGIPISAIPAGDDSYYDVNDDGFVTEVDALRVINALNAQDAGLAGGEPIAPQALGADDAVAATTGVAATVSSVESGGSKVVGGAEFDGESDLLELIAIDAAGGGSDSDGDGSLEANLDAAIADLF